MRCSVCGKPGEALSAVVGAACSPECATLVYVRPLDQSTGEMTLTAWVWRVRRAAAHGLPFDEAPPLTEGQRRAIIIHRMWQTRCAAKPRQRSA